MLGWISEIWQNLDIELVSKNFDSCGITSSGELHSVLDQMMHKTIIMNEVLEERDLTERLTNLWLDGNFGENKA